MGDADDTLKELERVYRARVVAGSMKNDDNATFSNQMRAVRADEKLRQRGLMLLEALTEQLVDEAGPTAPQESHCGHPMSLLVQGRGEKDGLVCELCELRKNGVRLRHLLIKEAAEVTEAKLVEQLDELAWKLAYDYMHWAQTPISSSEIQTGMVEYYYGRAAGAVEILEVVRFTQATRPA